MCVNVLISNIPKIVLTFQLLQMKLSSTNPNFLSYFLPCIYQFQANKLLQDDKVTSIYIWKNFLRYKINTTLLLSIDTPIVKTNRHCARYDKI